MSGDLSSLLTAAIGSATLALATYFGIARAPQGARMKRPQFLFALLFILFAMWIAGNFLAVILAIKLHVTEENLQQSQLIMRLVIGVLIGIPGLTALLRITSARCRDAGYSPRIAYLGATPLLQILFWIWLLFPRSVAAPQSEAA